MNLEMMNSNEQIVNQAAIIEGRATAHTVDYREAGVIREVAREAVNVARKTQRKVTVWNRKAMPHAYRWRFMYTQWTITAYPDGSTDLKLKRVQGPCNSASFEGIECDLDGVSGRELRWVAGVQRERVTRWCPAIVQAMVKFAL